jgi:hypothetical protein
MRQNLIKMRCMSILIRSVIMVVLLAGFQGMAVDVTCMVLWQAEPLELSQHDVVDHFTHHPNSSSTHQASSDAESSMDDVGAMLDQIDSASSASLLPKLQNLGAMFSQAQLNILSTHSAKISTPPEQTTII